MYQIPNSLNYFNQHKIRLFQPVRFSGQKNSKSENPIFRNGHPKPNYDSFEYSEKD